MENRPFGHSPGKREYRKALKNGIPGYPGMMALYAEGLMQRSQRKNLTKIFLFE